MSSVAARIASLARRIARRVDLQAFRLVVPAYLLLDGATLAIVPADGLGAASELRGGFGLASLVCGLALLWLGAVHLERHRAVLAYSLVALVQAVHGLVLAASAGWVGATTSLLIAAGLLLLGPSRARVRPDLSRPDLLVLCLATVNAIHGLALATRASGVQALASAGVATEPYGLAMLAAALVVLGAQLTAAVPRRLGLAASVLSGVLLGAIAVLAAVRLDPTFGFLGVPALLRAGALISQPVWQPRLTTIDWHSMRRRLTAGMVTAAAVPLFVFIVLAFYGPVDREPISDGARELTFGLFAVVVLLTSVIASSWGSAMSRAHRRVAAAVGTLRPGERWRAPAGRLDPELRTITDTVERLSERIADEQAANERRLAVSAAGEIALSSSLNLEVVAERLLDALVPAFCDSAVVYVREGDGMRRLALRIPPEVPMSGHAAATAEGMGPDVVFRTGQPQLYLDGVPAGYYAGLAADPGHERLISAMKISSLMLVPIVSTHGVMGVLSAALHGDQHFAPPDAAALQDLAARAALSIDNARLFEELARAGAVKDEFLGLISHELRTPMTTILGNALLLRRAPDDAAREQLLQDLEADAERLAGIVDNLLALARFEVAHRHMLEPTALHTVVRRCVNEIARANPARQISVETDGRPVVEGNAEQLEMVVRNLVGNALKYSPAESLVSVELRCTDDRANVLVLDRGPGIEDQEAAQLFDAFYRSELTGARVKGLGIGLAVCKRIVESLGGGVTAAARAGGGSIFGFWLPLVVLAADDPADDLVPVRSGSAAGGRDLCRRAVENDHRSDGMGPGPRIRSPNRRS